jgi:hypothetical protein
MIRPFALAATMFSLALTASPAAAYIAQNGFVVERGAEGQFAVLPRGGMSAPEAWCAAGDYALVFLGKPIGTRIWRISEVPRRAGESIVFSFAPDGAASSTGLVMLYGAEDGSLSATAAQQLCAMGRL